MMLRDYGFLRLLNPSPARLIPRSASVEGSGTELGLTDMSSNAIPQKLDGASREVNRRVVVAESAVKDSTKCVQSMSAAVDVEWLMF